MSDDPANARDIVRSEMLAWDPAGLYGLSRCEDVYDSWVDEIADNLKPVRDTDDMVRLVSEVLTDAFGRGSFPRNRCRSAATAMYQRLMVANALTPARRASTSAWRPRRSDVGRAMAEASPPTPEQERMREVRRRKRRQAAFLGSDAGRVRHFVNKVASSGSACGLYSALEGWATDVAPGRRGMLLLWPDEQYAVDASVRSTDFSPLSVSLQDLITTTLPELEVRAEDVGVMASATRGAVRIPPLELRQLLVQRRDELAE